jgi:hypothetical protein
MAFWKITERTNKILEDVCRRVLNLKGGPGIRVVNSPNGITIALEAAQTRTTANQVRQIMYAKTIAHTAINGLIRWKYTIEIGHWDMTTAPGTWVKDSGDDTIYAYNSAEDMNTFTGDGTIGTGNAAASSTGVVNAGSCNLLPIPDGAYVIVIPRGTDSAGQVYYTIVNFTNSAEIP